MSWEDRIIDEAELRAWMPAGGDSFRARIQGLLAQQQQTWPMLREAVAGLAEVKYQRLTVRGSEMLTQFNPRRIVSTAARVDPTSIKARPCFLCLENLPSEEQGIEFGPDFVALCNPFPVLPNHLVITSRAHTPQAIAGHLGALLDLTRELGAEWFTLYNGPRCGASAPDHLHFQACSRELLPLFRELGSWDRQPSNGRAAVEAFGLRDYRVNLLVLRGRDREALIDGFDDALRRLAQITGSPEEEPMLNLVATCEDGRWDLIFFPRNRHRPARYEAEEPARLTVSPAAIDLSGVLVVPQPDHFARITAHDIEQILAEVTLDPARFGAWLNGI